jgi:NADPH-dependent 2,4-dienoyl-CoA reductase/sulfur reductase-like enzyme
VRRVTIVGGSLAGLRAAQSLRREGFDGTIRIVSAEDHLPYDRPPMSKQLLAGEWEPARAALRGVDEADAEWLLGRRAVGLDVGALAVALDDGSVVDSDGVIIATGSAPRRLGGVLPEGVFELRTLADCLALRAAVASASAERVVVIGAGFIGSEVAATCVALGRQVTILEMLPIPLERAIGTEMGQVCAGLHRDHGVDLRLGVSVSGVGASTVDLEDGVIEADVVVVGVGVAPVVDWLAGSGLTIDNGVVCDSRCVAAPGVVVAGDVCRWDHPRYGLMRVEHWTNAAEQGAAAAVSLLRGSEAPPYAPVPYFWSDQHGTKIQFIGHNSPGDAVSVVEGSPEEGRFVASYTRDGTTTAVLLWNRPSRLAHWMDVLAVS